MPAASAPPRLARAFLLALAACAVGACSSNNYNCTIDCQDGSHHQANNVSSDGGDVCAEALASFCPGGLGMCECGSN